MIDHREALAPWVLETFEVYHCYGAHGCIISVPWQRSRPFKICYSGDTRPVKTLIDACLSSSGGVDLLIHEATFSDDMAEDALSKKHSTIKEAKAVFKDAKATALLMTHFSQRYYLREGAVDGCRLWLDGRIKERVDILNETIRILRGRQKEDDGEEDREILEDFDEGCQTSSNPNPKRKEAFGAAAQERKTTGRPLGES